MIFQAMSNHVDAVEMDDCIVLVTGSHVAR